MFDGLDQIRWDQLKHAYGSAEDVPNLLRALATDDPDLHIRVQDTLHMGVLHQGSIYSSTVRCVPFLIRLLDYPELQTREWILSFLAHIARSACEGEDFLLSDGKKWFIEQSPWLDNPHDVFEEQLRACRDAQVELLKGLGEFLSLLGDEDPTLRCGTVGLLVNIADRLDQVHAALINQLKTEEDEMAKATSILGVTILDNISNSATFLSIEPYLSETETPVVRVVAAMLLSSSSHDSIIAKSLMEEPRVFLKFQKVLGYFSAILSGSQVNRLDLRLHNRVEQFEPSRWAELTAVFLDLYRSISIPEENPDDNFTLAMGRLSMLWDASFYLKMMLRFAFVSRPLPPQTMFTELTPDQRRALETVRQSYHYYQMNSSSSIISKRLLGDIGEQLHEIGFAGTVPNRWRYS